jgi:hypothetical protein
MGNVAPGFESVQAVLVEYAEVGAVVRGGSGNREEPRVARVRTRRSARRRAENVVRSSFQQPRVSGLTGFAAGRRAASHESSQRGIRSVHRGGAEARAGGSAAASGWKLCFRPQSRSHIAREKHSACNGRMWTSITAR